MEKMKGEKKLTCNKKQTWHVRGEEVTSNLLPAPPEAVAVAVPHGNELRPACKERVFKLNRTH